MGRVFGVVVFVLVGVVGACGDDPPGAGVDGVADAVVADTAAADDAAQPADTAAADTAQVTDTEAAPDGEGAMDASAMDASATDTGETGEDVVAGVGCPPEGPFGVDVGDTLADATLVDCDGVPFSLHALCDRPAVALFTFAGWCPPCRSAAEAAPADYAALLALDPDAEMVIVVAETNLFETPTLAYCEAIRDGYGLTMKVLVDLDGSFPAHLGVTTTNSWHLTFAPGMRIDFKGKYGREGSLAAARELLGE